MNSYSHLDELGVYYEYRSHQCIWVAHARRSIWHNRKKRDQTGCIYALLLWAEAKYEADEMMPTLAVNWNRLHGQMNGKQGAK